MTGTRTRSRKKRSKSAMFGTLQGFDSPAWLYKPLKPNIMEFVYCVFRWSNLGEDWVLDCIFRSKDDANKFVSERADGQERKVIARYLM